LEGGGLDLLQDTMPATTWTDWENGRETSGRITSNADETWTVYSPKTSLERSLSCLVNVDEELARMWKEAVWASFEYYSSIWMKELRKTTWSLGENSRPPEWDL
jgi:hypothetical protein